MSQRNHTAADRFAFLMAQERSYLQCPPGRTKRLRDQWRRLCRRHRFPMISARLYGPDAQIEIEAPWWTEGMRRGVWHILRRRLHAWLIVDTPSGSIVAMIEADRIHEAVCGFTNYLDRELMPRRR